MFCKNCGAEIDDTARFCYKCGYDRMGEIQQNKKIVEDNVVRFQLKPTYSYSYKFLISEAVNMTSPSTLLQ